jgi:hypothetical protein
MFSATASKTAEVLHSECLRNEEASCLAAEEDCIEARLLRVHAARQPRSPFPLVVGPLARNHRADVRKSGERCHMTG